MIEFVPFPFLAGLGILALCLVLVRKKASPARLLGLAAFSIYMLALIGLILFPMPLPASTWRTSGRVILSEINLVPFYYLHFFKYTPNPYLVIHEILGNILVVVPFGFGLPGQIRLKAGSMICLAFGIGLAFEISQLAFNLLIGVSYRSVDITDVLLNALGALAGYALYLGIRRFHPGVFNRLKIW